MRLLTIAVGSISLLGSAAFAATVNTAGSTGYGLAGGGSEIVVFNNLSDLSTQVTLNLSGGRLDALAYRPFTGQLFGYSIGAGADPDVIYEVDTGTGALTNTEVAFNEGAVIADGASVGFDFNNSIDAARAVSTANDNLVFFPSNTASGNPAANTVIRAVDLFYADGDTFAGNDPQIFANAYTNAIDGRLAVSVDDAPATLQFGLDALTNSLVSINNNAGTLATIATVTFGDAVLDFTDVGGFEILSSTEGDNLALALLNLESGGNSGLYSIDVGSGVASFIGDAGRQDFTGFAAQVTPAPVPLPASALLLLAGLGGLGFAGRRRKAA